MTIERQYSLPNCKLILEGVGEEEGSAGRPPLSMLINVECHLTGYEKPLTGGREFLIGLVTAVSHYAQEYLSGIQHTVERNGSSSLVQLQKVNEDLHRLIVHPQEWSEANSAAIGASPMQMDLQTVQLFDLVEAVDQLCADTQTLPDLTPNIAPVSRRHIVSQEPMAKRAIPATVGISGLAVAAGLLFLVPLPEARRPEPVSTGATQESPTASPVSASPPNPPGTAPEAIANSPSSPDSTGSSSAIASPTPAASPTPIGSESPSPAEPSSALVAAPEITNASQLGELTQQLRNTLDKAWTTRPSFNEDLIYRVSVAANGDILGYRIVNDAAVEHLHQTPLKDLRYNPTSAASQEPIAQFRVVFTSAGAVEVSPWYGRPPQASPSP